jgi:hypothetical protein
MFLLRYRRTARYGAWLDREPSPVLPDDYYPPDQTADRLEFNLNEIAETGPLEDDEADDDPDLVAR